MQHTTATHHTSTRRDITHGERGHSKTSGSIVRDHIIREMSEIGMQIDDCTIALNAIMR